MNVFSEYVFERFVQEMVSHLAHNLQDQLDEHGIAAEDIESLVRSGIDRARTYEIFHEDSVQCFLEYMALMGPEFDLNERTRWAGDILRRADMEGRDKLNQIHDHLVMGGKTIW
jgi:hypothetical protein